VTCEEKNPGLYTNPADPEDCLDVCGDGKRMNDSIECDDGNKVDGDGCSKNCEIEY